MSERNLNNDAKKVTNVVISIFITRFEDLLHARDTVKEICSVLYRGWRKRDRRNCFHTHQNFCNQVSIAPLLFLINNWWCCHYESIYVFSELVSESTTVWHHFRVDVSLVSHLLVWLWSNKTSFLTALNAVLRVIPNGEFPDMLCPCSTALG